MSAVTLFLELKMYSLIFFLLLFAHHIEAYEYINSNNSEVMIILVNTGIDIAKSTYELVESVEYIKQKHLNTPTFEIGYMVWTTFEVYRKMLDKYNTSVFMRDQLYNMEILLYLYDIENHYWEMEHLTVQNMKDLKKVFNDSIYNDLSWSVKLLLIKDYLKTDSTFEATAVTPSPEPTPEHERRMPRMEALVIERRQAPPATDTTKQPNEEDNSMRLKLFRLMYETIRDSDLKCKRAELIRSHYENSSTFEIGYLMGDVMDKYNIMSDISMTLNRLFHEWKPIEHINAYEQISNQAIEINHLIDLMKGISKQNGTSTIK